MNKNLFVTAAATVAAILTTGVMSINAFAADDCVGECAALPTEKIAELDTIQVTATHDTMELISTCGKSSADELVTKAESLNNRIKPIKQLAGYVRSPQGLAIKVVNDHVMKIPAWVGYALDPVGSLKNKAMGEVKNRAKSAMGFDHKNANPCADTPASDFLSTTDETISDIAINAARIPLDTNI